MFISFPAIVLALLPLTVHSLQVAPHDYTQAHSYPTNTTFDKRDGWDSVVVSDLPYKYPGAPAPAVPAPHSRRGKMIKTATKTGGPLGGLVDSALKGIGEATSVIITWYTGQDLLNPSCWANSKWHPTDESFACALTLEGWTTRPKCFSFLELCNGSEKCIFVRVVDTCAGCKKGSKHVDLTKAAFQKLAPLEKGLLNVNMKISSTPKKWNTALWGPK